jgi:hypothetical protein
MWKRSSTIARSVIIHKNSLAKNSKNWSHAIQLASIKSKFNSNNTHPSTLHNFSEQIEGELDELSKNEQLAPNYPHGAVGAEHYKRIQFLRSKQRRRLKFNELRLKRYFSDKYTVPFPVQRSEEEASQYNAQLNEPNEMIPTSTHRFVNPILGSSHNLDTEYHRNKLARYRERNSWPNLLIQAIDSGNDSSKGNSSDSGRIFQSARRRREANLKACGLLLLDKNSAMHKLQRYLESYNAKQRTQQRITQASELVRKTAINIYNNYYGIIGSNDCIRLVQWCVRFHCIPEALYLIEETKYRLLTDGYNIISKETTAAATDQLRVHNYYEAAMRMIDDFEPEIDFASMNNHDFSLFHSQEEIYTAVIGLIHDLYYSDRPFNRTPELVHAVLHMAAEVSQHNPLWAVQFTNFLHVFQQKFDKITPNDHINLLRVWVRAAPLSEHANSLALERIKQLQTEQSSALLLEKYTELYIELHSSLGKNFSPYAILAEFHRNNDILRVSNSPATIKQLIVADYQVKNKRSGGYNYVEMFLEAAQHGRDVSECYEFVLEKLMPGKKMKLYRYSANRMKAIASYLPRIMEFVVKDKNKAKLNLNYIFQSIIMQLSVNNYPELAYSMLEIAENTEVLCDSATVIYIVQALDRSAAEELQVMEKGELKYRAKLKIADELHERIAWGGAIPYKAKILHNPDNSTTIQRVLTINELNPATLQVLYLFVRAVYREYSDPHRYLQPFEGSEIVIEAPPTLTAQLSAALAQLLHQVFRLHSAVEESKEAAAVFKVIVPGEEMNLFLSRPCLAPENLPSHQLIQQLEATAAPPNNQSKQQ